MSTTATGTLTLGNVLFTDAGNFSEQLGAGLDLGAESQAIKAALMKAAPGLPIAALLEGVAGAVHEMLDVPVTDVLVGAWNRTRDLKATLQSTRESPNATILMPLLSHTVTSEHRPYVDVVKDQVPIARLVFPVRIELRADGVVLRVHGGQISEILGGTLTVKATLKFGDFVILDQSLPSIPIPGELPAAQREAA